MNFSEYSKYEEWKNPDPNVKAINEWIEYGGFISCAGTKNGVELYTGEDAEADYCNWINEEKLKHDIQQIKYKYWKRGLPEELVWE